MLNILQKKRNALISAAEALPGRDQVMRVSGVHYVNGNSLLNPIPDGYVKAMFGLGCFWGAERKFWLLPGVYTTAVGYSAGFTPNPSYEEVCSGETGHNEVVSLVYDPSVIAYDDLLKVFWESHNPTQGMRQGNDSGTQYRSGIYCFDDKQLMQAKASMQRYQSALSQTELPRITTEIMPSTVFYFAEEYHQQYLAKNPQGYCGLGGVGVAYAE